MSDVTTTQRTVWLCRDLIGLPILSGDGKDLQCLVRDFIFDLGGSRVVALVVGQINWTHIMDTTVVPWAEVQRLSDQAIEVRERASLTTVGSDMWAREAVSLRWEAAFSATRMCTAEGAVLSRLMNTYLDGETGQVLGYDVAGQFVPGTLRGKTFQCASPFSAN